MFKTTFEVPIFKALAQCTATKIHYLLLIVPSMTWWPNDSLTKNDDLTVWLFAMTAVYSKLIMILSCVLSDMIFQRLGNWVTWLLTTWRLWWFSYLMTWWDNSITCWLRLNALMICWLDGLLAWWFVHFGNQMFIYKEMSEFLQFRSPDQIKRELFRTVASSAAGSGRSDFLHCGRNCQEVEGVIKWQDMDIIMS